MKVGKDDDDDNIHTHTHVSFFSEKRGERGGLRRHPSLMECATKLTISLDWKACYTIPSYINV